LVFSLCEFGFWHCCQWRSGPINNVFTSLFVFLEYFPLHSLTFLLRNISAYFNYKLCWFSHFRVRDD
jgi:hypothetical protein